MARTDLQGRALHCLILCLQKLLQRRQLLLAEPAVGCTMQPPESLQLAAPAASVAAAHVPRRVKGGKQGEEETKWAL